MKLGRRELLYLGAGAAAAGSGLWLLPGGERPSAYPLMRELGALDPLWSIDPQKLELATEEDAQRLAELTASLDRAVSRIEAEGAVLGETRVDALGAAARRKIRELWWQAFEPIVAIDALKHRYRGWYGLDYVVHPVLHSRAFALGFGGLCAQVHGGLRLLDALTGKRLAQTLFDEAVPELGVPARTFSAVRGRLGRARDLFVVPVGNEWYRLWIRRYLRDDSRLPGFMTHVDERSREALLTLATPSPAGVVNQVEIVQGKLFEQWFPLQKGFAEWVGDTRLARADRRLVSDAQLRDLRRVLEPGDVILERRNWYLSNVGLPGFWPHAALHTGSQSEILARLGSDAQVQRAYGDLGAQLARRYPAAWAALGERDAQGHERVILEAISEGVVAASVEHSCAADYVAALRPRRSPLARARAIERARAVVLGAPLRLQLRLRHRRRRGVLRARAQGLRDLGAGRAGPGRPLHRGRRPSRGAADRDRATVRGAARPCLAQLRLRLLPRRARAREVLRRRGRRRARRDRAAPQVGHRVALMSYVRLRLTAPFARASARAKLAGRRARAVAVPTPDLHYRR